MPKNTFHRLPEDKQQRIREAFYHEFAENSYTQASISRVVKELGIAKGSIYQYFESKKELFTYLLKYATSLRLEKLHSYFDPQNHDFFDQLIENFSRKIDFDIQYPLYSIFLEKVLHEKENAEIGNKELEIKVWLLELTTEIIKKYQDNNTITKNFASELIAMVIVSVQISMYDFLRINYHITTFKDEDNFRAILAQKKPEVMERIKNITGILKHGLKATK